MTSGNVDELRPIGVAFMDEDGTINLQLRAEGPGIVGDSFDRISPEHPFYQQLLQHLGGLQPGQSKPVPPWPDSGEEHAGKDSPAPSPPAHDKS